MCPTEEEYEQYMADIEGGRARRLGMGSFGEVYKVGNYVAKRIEIKDDYDRASYAAEVAAWAELTTYAPLKPYLPAFCGSREVDQHLPPRPVKPASRNREEMQSYWAALEIWHAEAYGRVSAYAYIFQKYEPVRDLEKRFEEWHRTPLSVEKGHELFDALIMGFSLFHKGGYIHRDIKPANILIRDADLSPIIVDFGLACKAPCNETGVVGTMAYVPQNLMEKNNNARKNYLVAFPVQPERVGFLQSLKRRMRLSSKTARKSAVRVKLSNTVALAKYNRASDRYAISVILKELISVIDWGEYDDWKRDCEQIVARYRAEIVPFLAASKKPELAAAATGLGTAPAEGGNRRRTRRRQLK